MVQSWEYPDWQKLIPTEFKSSAHFDTIEAIRAVSSLKALSGGKTNSVDLIVGDGKIVMASPDDSGQAELAADTEGELKIRFNTVYLAQVLKACGGMVDLKLTSSTAPAMVSVDGYQVVLMPMLITDKVEKPEAKVEQVEKPKGKRKAKAHKVEPAVPEPAKPEPVAEAEPEPVAA